MYWNLFYSTLCVWLNMININMRFIEINEISLYHKMPYRLTLTWDVLKLHGNIGVTTATARLTLTWDVLKCVTTVLCCRCVND